MRVAYFSYVYAEDGGSVHTREFLSAFASLGHHVSALWQNRAHDTVGKSSRRRRAPDYLKRFLSKWLHQPKAILQNIPSFLRELRFLHRVIPDILIVRQGSCRLSGVLLGRLYRIPVVLEVNAPGTLESRKYYTQYWHVPVLPELIERWVITRGDAITTVSNALQQYLVQSYLIPQERITVNPNGADPKRFDPAGVRRASLPTISSAAIVVGFCASFQEFHGADRVLDIASALADLQQVHFLLVGDGPARLRIQERIHRSGHGRRISMVGHVPHDEVPSYMALMDIGLMPNSNFYGSPIKMIEYMAMGLPVVGPRLGPLEEIVEEGVHGFLFSPDSVVELTKCLRRLVTDKDLRCRMGAAARAHVLDSLTWVHNARRVEATCKRAFFENKSRRRRKQKDCAK